MKDERYWPVLGTWLKDTVEAPPDPQQTARRVAERLPQTTQLGRHWWRPSPQRIPRTPAEIGPTSQPLPIPAHEGHTTVIGRTHSMFSPVKVITAGAIVFALGGAFLIAQPFDQQGSAPGAAAEAGAPMWVTGDIQPVDGTCSETGSSSAGGASRHHYVCTQTWTSSDPRLTGDVSRPWTEDTYQSDEGAISVGMDAAYLQNEGGSWACSNGYVAKGTGPTAESLTGSTNTFRCIGGGGYEGLSAMLVSELAEDFSEEFVGLIFPGDMPPVPEPPTAE